jgi:hypothetical protein
METIWDQSKLNLDFYMEQLATESYFDINAESLPCQGQYLHCVCPVQNQAPGGFLGV